MFGLCSCHGSQFESSCLHDRHFTHSAISFLMFPHWVHLGLYHSRTRILHPDTWRPGRRVQRRDSQVPVLGRQCTSYWKVGSHGCFQYWDVFSGLACTWKPEYRNLVFKSGSKFHSSVFAEWSASQVSRLPGLLPSVWFFVCVLFPLPSLGPWKLQVLTNPIFIKTESLWCSGMPRTPTPLHRLCLGDSFPFLIFRFHCVQSQAECLSPRKPSLVRQMFSVLVTLQVLSPHFGWCIGFTVWLSGWLHGFS